MFRFVGTGFLYNMVRILVGTLLEVGSGKRKPCDMEDILAKQDRQLLVRQLQVMDYIYGKYIIQND